MNEIYNRRSIRKFTDEPVNKETLNKILKAGMNAPTAMNSRPWEFIVINQKEKLLKLSEVNEYAFMLAKCPLAVAVIGKEKTVYWQQDLAASTQNILLEASSNDIGTCWIGVAPNLDKEEFVKNILNIPEDYRVLNLIVMGHPFNKKEVNNTFDENLIHYNNF